MNINRVTNTGLAPRLEDSDLKHFKVHIEHPQDGRCENIPLDVLVHLKTKKEISDGFKGLLPDGVWYWLETASGIAVYNWAFALRDYHCVES